MPAKPVPEPIVIVTAVEMDDALRAKAVAKVHELFGEDSTKTISMKNFLAGFIAGTTGKNQLMNFVEASDLAQTKMQIIKALSDEGYKVRQAAVSI